MQPKRRTTDCSRNAEQQTAAETPNNRLQPKRRTTDCSRNTEQQTAAETPNNRLQPKHRTTDCSRNAEQQTAAETPNNRLQPKGPTTDGSRNANNIPPPDAAAIALRARKYSTLRLQVVLRPLGCRLFFGHWAAGCSSAVRLHHPFRHSAFRLQLSSIATTRSISPTVL